MESAVTLIRHLEVVKISFEDLDLQQTGINKKDELLNITHKCIMSLFPNSPAVHL